MRQEIRELQQRLAITTVYVTHDQEEAMAVSDRIAVMNEGSVVQEGSAQRSLSPPGHRSSSRGSSAASISSRRASSRWKATRSSSTRWGRNCVRSPGRNAIAVGDAVSLLLRPEAIAIDADPSAGPLAGTVVSHAFLGEKIEYLVRCGDTLLQVVRYNAGAGDVIGDDTAVSLRPAAATLLAGAAR